MKFVKNIILKLKKIDLLDFFSFSWKISILSLPYQTRFFKSITNQISNISELGQCSFYISWFFLITTIVIGLILFYPKIKKHILKNQKIIYALFGLFLINIISQPFNWGMSLQWWAQIIILIVFFDILYIAQISNNKIINYFVISLIIPIIFSIAQFISQSVPSIKYLGLSKHDPVIGGTSIVLTENQRLLRVYSVFGHPNIFSAWLVFALLFMFSKIHNNYQKYYRLFFWIVILTISEILIFTFSRNAGLAVLVSLSITSLIFFKKIPDLKYRSILIFSFLGLLSLVVYPVFKTRIVQRSTVLEKQSLTERKQSIIQGYQLWQDNKFFGVGANNEILHLKKYKTKNQKHFESAHLLWLLVLDDFGFFGFLLIGYIFYILWIKSAQRFKKIDFYQQALIYSLIIAFVSLSLFDHYFWSYWSGQVLFILLIFITQNNQIVKTIKI